MGNGKKPSFKFLGLRSQFRRRSRHTGQGLLKEFAQFFVLCVRSSNPVALQDAAGLGVHHENRVLAGVKQD